MKIPCSVEILTLNSEKTLKRCLESVRDFEDIIILDGGSTDGTVALAEKYGACVIPQTDAREKEVKINDFSAVRNKGVKQARYPWFLFIDSDEYLSPEAVAEMREIVNQEQNNIHYAYKLPRKYVVNGEVVERSSMYPNYQLRFFYIPATFGFIKKIHERISVKEGYEIGILKNPEYVPMGDISTLKKKWYNYAQMQIHTMKVTPKTFSGLFLSNSLIFVKYLIKYALTFMRGSGKRMPFLYEWYNACYHIWLIKEAFISLVKVKK
ncbi:MAG: glycosyltransferase family 2 protein [Patescibacteria group bacterium]